MNDFGSQETGAHAKLRLENETLSQQVKRLIKAESKLYEYQEELDAQLNEYKNLYELNRKIHSTFDIRTIFGHAIEYVIHHLEYERVVFFLQQEDTGDYAVCALDGFYEPQEKDVVSQLVIGKHDPFILPLVHGGEYLLCQADSEDPLAYRAKLLMHEYLVYPLGSHAHHFALMAVGNSAVNTRFFPPVRAREDGGLR